MKCKPTYRLSNCRVYFVWQMNGFICFHTRENIIRAVAHTVRILNCSRGVFSQPIAAAPFRIVTETQFSSVSASSGLAFRHDVTMLAVARPSPAFCKFPHHCHGKNLLVCWGCHCDSIHARIGVLLERLPLVGQSPRAWWDYRTLLIQLSEVRDLFERAPLVPEDACRLRTAFSSRSFYWQV